MHNVNNIIGLIPRIWTIQKIIFVSAKVQILIVHEHKTFCIPLQFIHCIIDPTSSSTALLILRMEKILPVLTRLPSMMAIE